MEHTINDKSNSSPNISTNTTSHSSSLNGVAGAAQAASGPTRRKPTRRANTAERRATHNAVERQRRETLNARFLVSILVSLSSFPCF
jgi:hypothetical protein